MRILIAEDLLHVLERFYRADPSRSYSGFGLGPAIAGSIAEALARRSKPKAGQARVVPSPRSSLTLARAP